MASSADGTKLAAVEDGGFIYTSTDSGLTWTPRDSERYWLGVASSADGTKLVAIDAGDGTGPGGFIYTSSDSGVTWTPRESEREWIGVASSADGAQLIAVDGSGTGSGGFIYISTDSGATWSPRESERYWGGVASSADGNRLIALDTNGKIYTSGGIGTLASGAQGSSTTFQRLPNGQWSQIGGGGEIAPGSVGSAQLAANLTLAGTTTGSFAGNLAGDATNFTGTLAGDVTGTQQATAIADTTVTGKLLTGFVSAPGIITATDSILTAINKLSANASAGSEVLLADIVAPPLSPVVAWGDNHEAQSTVPPLANVIAISAGDTQSLALRADGTVVAWGTGPAVPGGLAGVTTLAAGVSHDLVRKSDGTVEGWGDNTYGQLDGLAGITNAMDVAVGEQHSLILHSDGSVTAKGFVFVGGTSVAPPVGLTGVTAIAAGYDHSLALKSDGTVAAWGRNDAGQVTGTLPTRGTIVEIIDDTRFRLSNDLAAATEDLTYDGATVLSSISDGSDVIVVASTSGLTTGMKVTGSSIVGPATLTNVVAIAANGYHSLALKGDGTVVAWGWDNAGQSAVPDSLSGVSKIAAGYGFSMALKTDGTVVVWGEAADGQTTVPSTATQVTQIAGGGRHALALRAELIPAQVARLDQDNVFTGKVGIKRVPAVNTLEVEGQASKTIAGNWLANSDRRIKSEIQPLTGALEKLDQVRLVDFRYTEDYRAAHPGIPDKRYLNVIAQEFAQVFPDHVQSSGETLPDGSEILQVDTYPLTIYSAAAVQELHRENEALKKQLAQQKIQLMEQDQATKAKLAEQEERLRKLEAVLVK